MPNEALIFKRPRYIVAITDASVLITTVFCVWLTINAFFFYQFEDVIKARILSSGFLVVFCPVLFVLRTFIGDMHVDEEGIGWWAWGYRWRYIRWPDVKVMTIKTITQASSSVTFYSLYRTEKIRQFDLLRFDDHIPNATVLIDTVTRYVSQHGGAIKTLPGNLN